jgi:hypothetical protein
MDQVLGPIIAELLKLGAPWIIASVFIALFIAERKRKDELADKLHELGMASVKKDTEVHLVLEAVRKDVEELRRLGL